MTLELTADHPAVEQQGVEREAGEPEAEAVEHGDDRNRLALDARLLEDLFHRDLTGRVPHIGVADRVEPHSGVGALGEEQFAPLVADDRRDRDLRRHVALDALAHARQPLVVERFAFGFLDRDVADVGRDLEDLLEPFLLVQALGEPEPGPGDGGEGLRPAEEIDGGGTEGLGQGGETNPDGRERSSRVTTVVRRVKSVARNASTAWRSANRFPAGSRR